MADFFDEALEESLLSVLLNNIPFCDQHIHKISSPFFSNNKHLNLFDAIYDHFIYYNDLLTEQVFTRVMKENNTTEDKIEEYLLLYHRLKDRKVLEGDALYSIDKLQDLYLKRESYNLISDTIEDLANKKGNDVLNSIEEKLVDIKENSRIVEITQGFVYQDVEKDKEEYLTAISHPEKQKSIPYGIAELDKHTGGMEPSKFYLIVSGPKNGKSRTLFNMGFKNTEIGNAVMYITLEMPKAQVKRMYYSRKGQLSYNRLKNPHLLSEEEKAIYLSLLDSPDKDKFYIVDVPIGCTPLIIRQKINQFKRTHKLDLVIIDYITLVEGNKKYSAGWEKEVDVAKQFKQIARVEHVPILSAAQITKEARKGNKVGMEWIALGDLAPHCDLIIQLLKQTDEQKEIGLLDAQIVADRDGGPLAFSMAVNWDLNFVGDKSIILNKIQADLEGTSGNGTVGKDPQN